MTDDGTVTPSARAVATSSRSAPVKVYPLRDTSTMLRRNVKQEMRDKVAILAITGIPVLFLLLFVYVFGGSAQELGEGGRRAQLRRVRPAGADHHDRRGRADRHIDADERRHDGRHHRPVQDDGDLPAGHSHRARRGEHAADPGQHGGRLRDRLGGRLSLKRHGDGVARARPGCLRSSPSPWPGWAWPSASPPRPSLPRATGRSR